MAFVEFRMKEDKKRVYVVDQSENVLWAPLDQLLIYTDKDSRTIKRVVHISELDNLKLDRKRIEERKAI